jgi:8-oxo-dGTP pyrophosphatase MutT (NUDIX family)
MMKKIIQCNPSEAPCLLCSGLVPVKEAYRNKWFKVMDRGSYFTFEYDRPQVVVLPVLENSNIIMVRVKRPIIDDNPLELPAGDSLPEETPVEAARRELEEETGIRIESLARFNPMLPISEMPGRIPVLLSIFEVQIHMKEFIGRKTFDCNEIKSVEYISINDIVNKIKNGEIYLSSPMAILSRFIFSNMKEVCRNG